MWLNVSPIWHELISVHVKNIGALSITSALPAKIMEVEESYLYLKGTVTLGDIPFLKHDLGRTTVSPFRSWMLLQIVGAEISGTQISEGSADC